MRRFKCSKCKKFIYRDARTREIRNRKYIQSYCEKTGKIARCYIFPHKSNGGYMREDFMEQLDKMFPDGYVVLYTCPNSTFRMSLYNPHKYEIIEKYHELIKSEVDNG